MGKLKNNYESLSPENKKKLQDLSEELKEVTLDKEGWCYKYIGENDIGKAIREEFINFNQNRLGKPNQFLFSEEFESAGLLSQLQGFQILASLYEDFDIPLTKEDKANLIAILDDVLARIQYEDGSYHFDASPYLSDSHQFDTFQYIDSLTWFLSVACSVFRLMLSDKLVLDEKRETALVEAFKFGMKYLTDSFIDNDDPDAFSCGWNYTMKPPADENVVMEPSLYFTFAVSEFLLDIYKTFNFAMKESETELVVREIDRILGGDSSKAEEILNKKEQIRQILAEFKEQNKYKKEAAEREHDLFKRINGDADAYPSDGSYSFYADLEEKCKKAAECIWRLTSENLADSFYSSNLRALISEDVIEQSITSDALFNSILILNIVVDAGLDEDVEDKINYFTFNGTPEYQQAVEEYDNMRDTVRLGYDNVYQMYNRLRKKNCEYKVNEYILSFPETFKGRYINSAKELRKARIRVFSLMPLLVKTKTTIGEFVIRYPQYDMQLYLEQILKHRYVDDSGNTLWIWERDGYSSSDNYYFISALSDFFRYYREYELQYSKNAANNKKARSKIESEYLDTLRSSGEIYKLEGEKEQLKEENAQKDAQIAQLTQEIGELKKDPLRSTLEAFIYNAVKERMDELFVNMLLANSRRMVEKAKENASDADSSFEDSVYTFMWSMFSEQAINVIRNRKPDTSRMDVELSKAQEATKKDLQKAFQLYLDQVYLLDRSDFVATNGYSLLRSVLENERSKVKDNDKK